VVAFAGQEIDCDQSELNDGVQWADLGVESLLSLTISGRLREDLNLEIESTLFTEYASAKYDTLSDAGAVPHGEAILPSDFGMTHSSTEYLTANISRESYEPINPDIQDGPQRPSDFKADGWRFGSMAAAASTSLVFLTNLSVTI
jgi:hypothetical protein